MFKSTTPWFKAALLGWGLGLAMLAGAQTGSWHGAVPSGLIKAWPMASGTQLIEFNAQTPLSELAQAYRVGGYEAAGGHWIGHDAWYRADVPDVRISWMTPITAQWGLIWGLNTGEQGPKYTITPGLRLGVANETRLSPHWRFSMRAMWSVGSRFKEKPCTADYGDIGGVQAVNCRLAAGLLSPAETLQYLTHAVPHDHRSIWLRLTYDF